jgi:hypothetical protein
LVAFVDEEFATNSMFLAPTSVSAR